MKISYAVGNLRSVVSMPLLDLRPITVLLGRNSAGKSTYLRSFALLRQSIEARSSAPILWYGDYVDFGDFGAAVSFGDTRREISFRFRVGDLDTRSYDLDYYPIYDDYTNISRTRQKIVYDDATFEVSLGEQIGRTVRRRISLNIPSMSINADVRFQKDGRQSDSFKVNGIELSDIIPSHAVYFNASNIFSSPVLIVLTKVESRPIRKTANAPAVFASSIVEIIQGLVDKRVTAENLKDEARHLLDYSVLNEAALIELRDRTRPQTFKKLYDKWRNNPADHTLQRVNTICAFNASLIAIGRIGAVLRDYFLSTTYLGPARARSERYYRFQELEVSEISPNGENLPMFLATLAGSELQLFSDWVEQLFGYGVGIKQKEGHISIQLSRSDFFVNVADTGYGVSQLLPVLAQIWWASRSNLRRSRSVSQNRLVPITMEQPELHLHPAHQARLADALLKALSINENRSSTRPIFVVETHSEALINRLGELIEAGDLSKEDVQIIVFFSESRDEEKSTIQSANFEDDGSLSNWPYGFFNY